MPTNATLNAATKYAEDQNAKQLQAPEENNSNGDPAKRTSPSNNVRGETSQESQVARGPNEAERQPSNTTAERASDVRIGINATQNAHQTVVADATALKAENNVLKNEIEKKDIQIKEKDAKIAELTAKLEAKASEPGSSPGAGEAPVSQPESSEPEPKTDEEAKARGQKEAELVAKEILRFNTQESDGSIKEEDKLKKAELEKKQPLLLQLAEKGLEFLKENPELLKKVTISPAPAAPGPSAASVASAPNALVTPFLNEFKNPTLQTFSNDKYTVTKITDGFSIVKKKQ